MSSEQKDQPTRPTLCANNCGFYGNPANRNLCSKCYHDFLQKEAARGNQCSRLSDQHRGSGLLKLGLDRYPERGKNEASSKIFQESSSATSSVSECSNISVADDKLSSSIELQSQPSDSIGSIAVPSDEKYSNFIDPSNLTGTASSVENVNETPVQEKDTTRCSQCNRKVGLLGFPCRCGLTFCGKHLAGDVHDCKFDYKTFDREQLRKQNNRVVADKLEKL